MLKVQFQGVADLVSPEAFLLALQMAAFSLSLHSLFSVYSHLFFCAYEDTSYIGLKPYPDNLILTCNYFFKGLVFKFSP